MRTVITITIILKHLSHGPSIHISLYVGWGSADFLCKELVSKYFRL